MQIKGAWKRLRYPCERFTVRGWLPQVALRRHHVWLRRVW